MGPTQKESARFHGGITFLTEYQTGSPTLHRAVAPRVPGLLATSPPLAERDGVTALSRLTMRTSAVKSVYRKFI